MSGGILVDLFDSDVITAEDDPRLPPLGLHPREASAVARAVPKRQAEYAAGRRCARRALAELGVEGWPLLNGIDRAPEWPDGIVGTISHTDAWCGVAVTRRARYLSLGLDAEPDQPLDPWLWDTVYSAREREWLTTHPEKERGHLASLLFSAKECAYKCQYPLTGELLDFHDFELSVDLTSSTFRATLTRTVGTLDRGTTLEGRFLRRFGLFVTATSLRADTRQPD